MPYQVEEFVVLGLFFRIERVFLIRVIKGPLGLETVALKLLTFLLESCTDIVSGFKSYLFSASLKSGVSCAISIKVSVLSIKGVKYESKKD